MEPTSIIHINDAPAGWERDPRYVYIGRAGRGRDGYYGSPVRRVRKEDRPHQERDRCPVCKTFHEERGSTLFCFEKEMHRRLREEEGYRQRLLELEGKILVCFCLPPLCHGAVMINWLREQAHVRALVQERKERRGKAAWRL